MMEKPKCRTGRTVPDSGGGGGELFFAFAIAVVFLMLFGGC